MKKILISALVATSALGLAACGEEATTTDDTVMTDGADTTSMDDGTMAADPVEGDAPSVDGDGADTVSVGEDGVSANINEGDTSVSVDEDGATVTTDN